MSAPIRIQRKRVKGWRMPANTVCVTRPGKWGNPFYVVVDDDHNVFVRDKRDELSIDVDVAATRDDGARLAVSFFTEDLHRGKLSITVADVIGSLRGKNLACFCPIGSPCHADVLLEIANGGAK